MRCIHRLVLPAAAALCAGLPSIDAAADSLPHAHANVPIAADAALGWNDVIDAALASHPRTGELLARTDEAAAWTTRGKNWLAAAPVLYFSYLSDGALDDRGQLEYDAGVELPLWRGGERDAVRGLASSATTESAAAATALRLEVAGLLRGALWDIEAIENDIAEAREASQVADDLVRTVERRNARGDLPLADVLLAQADRLEKQQAVVAREAELIEAARVYRSLTGLDRRPLRLAERRAAQKEFDARHPLVALADAEVARARASVELTDREVRGNVMLTMGSHRQRDPLTDFFNDSITLGVKVPIGGPSHGVAQHARAQRLVADSEAQRAQLLRRLDLDLHEAENTLVVLDDTLALAEQRRDLALRQLQMARSAFAQGEIELRDLLRIQQAAQSAEREVRHLGIERQRTISAYNQAIGELP